MEGVIYASGLLLWPLAAQNKIWFYKANAPPVISAPWYRDEGREDELDWHDGRQEIEEQWICFTSRYHQGVRGQEAQTSFTHPSTHPYTHDSPIYSFISSLIHPSVHSLIHQIFVKP